MRILAIAAIVCALAGGAFATEPVDLDALRVGEMARFNFDDPQPARDGVFLSPDQSEHKLSDFRGSPVLINFWATWCPPCRKEMPSLDRLQAALGDDAHVLTIAAGRNSPRAIDAFFAEAGVTRLPKFMDPQGAFAREMSVFGLPVSILLDADGHVVGRLIGDAEWDSPEAIGLIRALIREE